LFPAGEFNNHVEVFELKEVTIILRGINPPLLGIPVSYGLRIPAGYGNQPHAELTEPLGKDHVRDRLTPRPAADYGNIDRLVLFHELLSSFLDIYSPIIEAPTVKIRANVPKQDNDMNQKVNHSLRTNGPFSNVPIDHGSGMEWGDKCPDPEGPALLTLGKGLFEGSFCLRIGALRHSSCKKFTAEPSVSDRVNSNPTQIGAK
jgi:hypothetical protein